MKKSKMEKTDVCKKTVSASDNALLYYMEEINKIPLLSKEEEEKLTRLAAEGDKHAREKLVNSNLRFVIMIAKKYQGKGLDIEDLISEGNIGMLYALNHFNADKGYRFITYAVWWIRQAIIKAIHEKGRMIRLPSNKVKEIAKIEKTKQRFQNEPGTKNNTIMRDIAVFLDIPQEKASNLMQLGQDAISLDDPASLNEESLYLIDFIEDTNSATPVEQAMQSALKDDLNKVLSGLEKREADVIRCRYGLDDSNYMTLKEIGARFNLSRERVRQIENRAITQLQESSGRNHLDSYIA